MALCNAQIRDVTVILQLEGRNPSRGRPCGSEACSSEHRAGAQARELRPSTLHGEAHEAPVHERVGREAAREDLWVQVA